MGRRNPMALTTGTEALAGEPTAAPDGRRTFGDVRRFLRPDNASVLYIYVAGFIVFSLWIPDLWLSAETHKSILNISFPIPALVAVGLILPLLAGAFDLSIAGVMGASAITSSWLVVDRGWSVPLAVAAALLVAIVAGVVNGVLVVKVGMNSFIATLGTGAILGAYAEWRSGGVQI